MTWKHPPRHLATTHEFVRFVFKVLAPLASLALVQDAFWLSCVRISKQLDTRQTLDVELLMHILRSREHTTLSCLHVYRRIDIGVVDECHGRLLNCC